MKHIKNVFNENSLGARNLIIMLFMLLIIFGSFRCNRSHVSIPTVRFTEETSLLTITSWRIIGPFKLPDNAQVYTIENERNAFNFDYLTKVNGTELPFNIGGQITKEKIDFNSDLSLIAPPNKVQSPSFINQIINFPIPQVSSHMIFGLDANYFKIMYAITDITSENDKIVHLIVSGNSPTKIWVNDKVVAMSPKGSVGNAQQIQHLAQINLKSGQNRLVVKFFCFPILNEFAVRLASKESAQTFIKNRSGIRDLFDNVIVEPGVSLQLTDNLQYFNIVDLISHIQYEIEASDGRQVAQGEVSIAEKAKISTANLPQGLYRLILHVNNNVYTHPFYIGFPDRIYHTYRDRCTRAAGKEDQNYEPCLSLAGLQENHKTVIDMGFRQDWQKKALIYAEMIENGLNNSHSGFQMHSYHSPIDDQDQFYIFYMPRTVVSKQQLPLVIEVPHNAFGAIVSQGPGTLITGESISDPYYKLKTQSLISRDANYLLRLSMFCDEYGYACMFPYTRFRQFEDPLAIADMRESLDNAKKIYQIDLERVYLHGFCRGGGNSIKLAEYFPDEFAAVSSMNLNIVPNSFPVLNKTWEKINDIRNYTNNLLYVPIQLIHGKHFPHSPVDQSKEFYSICKNNGLTTELEFLAGDAQWDDRDEYRIAYEFFKGKKRNKNPFVVSYTTGQLKYSSAYWVKINRLLEPGKIGNIKAVMESSNEITISTENVAEIEIIRDLLPIQYTVAMPLQIKINGVTNNYNCIDNDTVYCTIILENNKSILQKNLKIEGPIAHAFSQPFILVQGSGGNSDFQNHVNKMTDNIQTYWEGKHYVRLRRKVDSEITADELINMNIIFVGDASTDSLIYDAYKNVPVSVTSDSVKVGKHVHFSKNALVVACYPNPQNLEKYIVVINANEKSCFDITDDKIDFSRYGVDVIILDNSLPIIEWIWDNNWDQLIPTL